MKKLFLTFALLFTLNNAFSQFVFAFTPADSVWHNLGGWSGIYLYEQKDSTGIAYGSFWRFTSRIVEARNLSNEFANENHDTVVVARSDGRLFKTIISEIEKDPIFSASPSHTISNINTLNWNTAFGWGNHAAAGYLTSIPAQSFASLTGKPTTLTGYGITDAQSKLNGTGFVKASGTTISYDNSNYLSSVVANTGISITSGSVITNTLPDQTVALTGSNGITTSGTYPNFTIEKTKRQETYSGTTNASGSYTVTYGTAYSATPNVQFQIGTGGNNKETILLTASSTTGFTVYVQLRADVLGLLPSYSNVNGRNVDVLVTEK